MRKVDAAAYTAACDAAFRWIEREFYGREWVDDFQHTSDKARAIALAVIEAYFGSVERGEATRKDAK